MTQGTESAREYGPIIRTRTQTDNAVARRVAGWVTDVPDELCVRAAAAVIRLRPAAPPGRARALCTVHIHGRPGHSSRRTRPNAWQVFSAAASQAVSGPWQAVSKVFLLVFPYTPVRKFLYRKFVILQRGEVPRTLLFVPFLLVPRPSSGLGMRLQRAPLC